MVQQILHPKFIHFIYATCDRLLVVKLFANNFLEFYFITKTNVCIVRKTKVQKEVLARLR